MEKFQKICYLSYVRRGIATISQTCDRELSNIFLTVFLRMHVVTAKAKCDRWMDTERWTEDGQSDPYVALCFADATTKKSFSQPEFVTHKLTMLLYCKTPTLRLTRKLKVQLEQIQSLHTSLDKVGVTVM